MTLINIGFKEWQTACDTGTCVCNDVGCTLTINGKLITNYYFGEPDDIVDVVAALGHPYRLVVEDMEEVPCCYVEED